VSWAGQLRQVSGRTSLRAKLVASVLLLVLAALVAMGTVGVSLLRGQMLAPYTDNLRNVPLRTVNQCLLAMAAHGDSSDCPQNLAISWIPTSGPPLSIYTPSYDSAPPDLSHVAPWLVANLGSPTTVPASSGTVRWRVMGFQQPSLSVNQQSGTLVIGFDVTSVYDTIRRLIGVDIIVSAAILLVAAIAGFWLVRSNLRPLVDIEETAGDIAEGNLNRRIAERDPRTEIGSLGRSLNLMLGQIESAFHDREESEAAAVRSEERMRRFVADASHELRTPLTTIRGFAEYYRQRGGYMPDMGDSGLSPEDLDRIMQRVEAEAARMGLLVEDLLLLARMDQQRPLARSVVDVLVLTADAVQDAQMLAPDRKIGLSVQRGAAFLVNGDEPRLRQVIGNLMSNALTHTPDGTPIEVSIGSGVLGDRSSTPAVVLTITDHGPGMTREQADRVFERFYRVDAARTRAKGGSGLGLAIVSALVDAHGGAVSVQTAHGAGASFRVALPLAPNAQGAHDPDDELDDELDDDSTSPADQDSDA
jgi:two-component system OmpR family sensor kinase